MYFLKIVIADFGMAIAGEIAEGATITADAGDGELQLTSRE